MNPRAIAIALLAGAPLAGCGHVAHQAKATLTSQTPPVASQGGAVASPGGTVASGGRLFNEGRTIFIHTGCGGCHTVAAAHTTGQLGPDFDTSERLNRAQILTEIDGGANGMPSYQHTLTPRQKRAVTEFIFKTMHARR